MKQSRAFIKTLRQPPTGETSANAQLLEQAGYVQKMMAGVYAYLPLGLLVFNNITKIIREELTAIGAHELYLSALQPKDVWDATGRWDELAPIMYQFTDHTNHPVGLATIVEMHHDNHGIVWPDAVAPVTAHLIRLGSEHATRDAADELYEKMQSAGIAVLYDDRDESDDAKLKDADLIGIPHRIIMSDKTGTTKVEYKKRNASEAEHLTPAAVIKKLQKNV